MFANMGMVARRSYQSDDVVAGPEGGVALPAREGRAGQDERPLVRPQARQPLVGRPRVISRP